MNLDEFAFFNRQLSGMLKTGIPLEGAIRQLCKEMRGSPLKEELQFLEKDLANGTRMDEALARRKLPPLYIQLLRVGLRGNRLPEMLTLVADHYEQTHSVMVRLKGLMLYPLLVLGFAFLISLATGYFVSLISSPLLMDFLGGARVAYHPRLTWVPTFIVGFFFFFLLIIRLIPSCWNSLPLKIPAVRNAHLARLADSIHLLLKGGTPLEETLSLLMETDKKSPFQNDLKLWRERLAQGKSRFTDMALPTLKLPLLFIWIVVNSGENLADGFQKAASIYRERARYQTEVLLYVVLPASILILGPILLFHFIPIVGNIISVITNLSNEGSG